MAKDLKYTAEQDVTRTGDIFGPEGQGIGESALNAVLGILDEASKKRGIGLGGFIPYGPEDPLGYIPSPGMAINELTGNVPYVSQAAEAVELPELANWLGENLDMITDRTMQTDKSRSIDPLWQGTGMTNVVPQFGVGEAVDFFLSDPLQDIFGEEGEMSPIDVAGLAAIAYGGGAGSKGTKGLVKYLDNLLQGSPRYGVAGSGLGRYFVKWQDEKELLDFTKEIYKRNRSFNPPPASAYPEFKKGTAPKWLSIDDFYNKNRRIGPADKAYTEGFKAAGPRIPYKNPPMSTQIKGGMKMQSDFENFRKTVLDRIKSRNKKSVKQIKSDREVFNSMKKREFQNFLEWAKKKPKD